MALSAANSGENKELAKAWRSMMESMDRGANLKAAKTIDRAEMVNVPLTIFGARTVGASAARFVVATVGPFDAFANYDVEFTRRDAAGRRIIDAVRDTRPAKVKDADKKSGKKLTDYKLVDIEDVRERLDPECKYARVRKSFREGEVLELRDETANGSMRPGVVCLAVVEPLIWHNQKDGSFRVAVNLKIKRTLCQVQMPRGDFVEWMASQDMATRHFETEFPRYEQFREERPDASESETKNAAYRENLVMIQTGAPNDYTNPRFMAPDTCLLLDKTDRDSDDTFWVEDYKTKAKKPILALEYKGMQWEGPRTTPEYQPSDTLFGVFPTLYSEHLAELDVMDTANWKRLMAPVCGMLRGVYVGKENAKTGAMSQLNQERLAAVAGSWDEKTRQLNAPTGDGTLSFSLMLSTVTFLFDPVTFITSVCPRVSPEKIRQRWGNSGCPKDIGVDVPREFAASKLLVCLSECDPHGDLSSVLSNPKYEFRVLTTAFPEKTSERRRVYEKLSKLTPEEGDQFLDVVERCVFTGEDEFLEDSTDIAADHISRLHRFKYNSKLVYFFAINREEWDRQRNAGLDKMRKVGGAALALESRGGGKRALPDAQDPPAKRAKKASANPDEVVLQQSQDDDDDDDDDDEDEYDDDDMLDEDDDMLA